MEIKTNDYLGVHMGCYDFLSDEIINDILVNSTFVKDGQTVNPTHDNKRICKIYEPPKQLELAEYISDFIIKKNEEILATPKEDIYKEKKIKQSKSKQNRSSGYWF